MYVCVRAHARVHFLLVLVCIRACSISVCVGGCLCRYVCLQDITSVPLLAYIISIYACLFKWHLVVLGPRGLTFFRGGDVTVYALDINQPSFPTPFYSVLVSVSVFMALSICFIP